MLPPFKTAGQLIKELRQNLLDSLPTELKELCSNGYDFDTIEIETETETETETNKENNSECNNVALESNNTSNNTSNNANNPVLYKKVEGRFSTEIGETIDAKLVTLYIYANKFEVVLSYLSPEDSEASTFYHNFEYEQEIIPDFGYTSENYLDVYTDMVNFLNQRLLVVY